MQTTPMAWSRAYGGNIAFKRSMCETIPEYDCGFIGYGGEDVDLSYQLYLQGFRYVFNRMAINYHQEHIRGTDEMRSIYKNFNYFHDKYKSLEIFLMKMEWEGKITFDQSNAFLSVINREKDNINGLILEYLER